MEVNFGTSDTSVYMNIKTFKGNPLEASVFSIESSCRHVTLQRIEADTIMCTVKKVILQNTC